MRTEAINEGREKRIVFDNERQTLTTAFENLSLPEDALVEFQPSGPHAHETMLVFYPSGRISGGTATIRRGSIETKIEFNWASGLIRQKYND